MQQGMNSVVGKKSIVFWLLAEIFHQIESNRVRNKIIESKIDRISNPVDAKLSFVRKVTGFLVNTVINL